MKIRNKIKVLNQLYSKYGFFVGTYLFVKIYLEYLNSIKIPDVKYPFKLRPKSSDIPAFYEVFLRNSYDITLRKTPTIIIDGGANIGLFSIKIKNQYPDANVICIEPDSGNFELLAKNLSPYKNVFFENAALWNRNVKLRISDKFEIGKWAMVVEEDTLYGNVTAISIGYLFEKYNINYLDVLKLDVETSEKQIFSENYEEWLPKVKMIIIELHDWMEQGSSRPFFEAINNTFKKYTYLIQGESTIIINEDI